METIAAEAWLQGTLSTSTALGSAVMGIYAYQSPQGTLTPYVIYNYQAGIDENNVNGTAVTTNALYQVKVVHAGTAGMYAAGTIFDIIRPMLEGKSGTALGYNILACAREQPIQYIETFEGQTYLHFGALYRVFVAGTA
jgi:hypothetical protein